MAEITHEEVKFLFQEKVLKEHGEYLKELFQESIEERNLIDTRDLLTSIRYEVVSNGKNRELHFYFNEYGRFIEINQHKRKRKSKFEINTNRDIWGLKENSMKKNKRTDWYSKNAWGSLNRLQGILMYEFTDEVIDDLKKSFGKNNTIKIII